MIAVASASTLAMACGERAMPASNEPTAQLVQEFATVSQAQWDSLASKQFLFGHQSVGGNILQGVEEVVARTPAIRLRIVDLGGDAVVDGPGLFHARIGVNGDPASKLSSFGSLAADASQPVAMMKFCYLDVDGSIGADSLFAAYQRGVAALRAKRPDLVVVHSTLPLTDIGNWKERVVKTLKRRPTTRKLNALRNDYNAMLLAAYAGKEPVFDIATIESTRPDGTRSFFMRGDRRVYHLAPELTDDGGHLNEAGRRAAAERFLALLATL